MKPYLLALMLCVFGSACISKGPAIPPVELIPEELFPIDINSKVHPRTIIVSHSTLDAPFIKSSIDNHRQYAKKHDYDYWFRNGNIDNGYFSNPDSSNRILKLGLYWQKVALVQEVMQMKEGNDFKYDWILWIDGDAIFTDLQKSLEDLRNEAHMQDSYFLVAKDLRSCVNAGVFLIHNDQRGRIFMDNLRASFAQYKYLDLPEQTAIEDLILGVKYKPVEQIAIKLNPKNKCTFRRIDGTMIVEQHVMNAFYAQRFPDSIRWKPGLFIAHFAGDNNRNKNIPKLLACMKAHQYGDLSGCEDGAGGTRGAGGVPPPDHPPEAIPLQ